MPGGDVTGGGGIGAGGIVGIVGKLPAHGDFVRRGEPVAVLASIDRWLDRELGAIVATGTPLDDAVDALNGVRGSFGHAGDPVLTTLIASGDAVGRRFPLVATLTGARAGYYAAEAWCAAVAAALAAMRDGGGDADAALAAVATIALPAVTSGDTPATGWWRVDDGRADDEAVSERGADAPVALNEADDAAVVVARPASPIAAPNEADGDATLPSAGATPVAPAKRWWRPRSAAAAPPSPAIVALAALPTGPAFHALLAEARR